jgi:DNA-directed RNA polymerase subunit M/transcription elongation factor TFIIS
MLDWLRQIKMVRHGAEPELDLLVELFRAALPKFTCPRCGATGLVVRPVAEENDEDWGMARACEECGRPIANERLEIFPDARLCVTCQASADQGGSTGPGEYCPRCGNLMAVRQTRTAGITRYMLACPKCRR